MLKIKEEKNSKVFDKNTYSTTRVEQQNMTVHGLRFLLNRFTGFTEKG